MKAILLFTFFLVAFSIQGQSDTGQNLPVHLVIYNESHNSGSETAYFISEVRSSHKNFQTLNADFIENIAIEAGESEWKGKMYSGKIKIQIKEEFRDQIMTLTDLKHKHTSLTDESTIFLVDNELVREDYNGYFVDEKNILSIEVDEVSVDGRKIEILRLFTRSEENIRLFNKNQLRSLAQ